MFSGYQTTDSLNVPIPFHSVWSETGAGGMEDEFNAKRNDVEWYI